MKGYFSLTKPYFTIRSEQDSRQCASQNQTLLRAATAAANRGLEDSTIRTLGRWSNSAFLTYIHTHTQRAASADQIIKGIICIAVSTAHMIGITLVLVATYIILC